MGGLLLFRLLLPCLLPFLLGFGLSLLLERPVSALCSHFSFSRPFAAVITTLGLVLLTSGLAWGLVRLLLREGGGLPALFRELEGLSLRLRDWTDQLLALLPPSLRAPLAQALSQLSQLAPSLAARFSGWLARSLAALPRLLLCALTTLLSALFITADRPALARFLTQKMPERWVCTLHRSGCALRCALTGWLRAQGLLLLVTASLLTLGFALLRVRLPLLCALFTALVDALPVLGVGLVLLPWSLLSLLRGRGRRAAGLLILYGVLALTRSTLEPRLVGKQAGLHPLAALGAMYVGAVVAGPAGMVLLPLAAILCKALWDQDRA